jgi:hypothetical protein
MEPYSSSLHSDQVTRILGLATGNEQNSSGNSQLGCSSHGEPEPLQNLRKAFLHVSLCMSILMVRSQK